MKSQQLILFLSTVLPISVVSFGLLDPVIQSVTAVIKAPRSRLTVLPKVTLPKESVLTTANLEAWTQPDPTDGENVLFAFLNDAATKAVLGIAGKPKQFDKVKGLFESIQKLYIDKIVETPVTDGYLYYGNGNNVETLSLLLTHNPFFTSALTSDGDEYKISSTGDSWYSKILSVATNDISLQSAKKDASFDKNMRLKDGKTDAEKDDIAGQLLYALTYYVQNVHALIHVLHYVSVLAIGNAAEAYPTLGRWAEKYISNVGVKYIEVQELLWAAGAGALTRSLDTPATSGLKRLALLDIMTDILIQWGKYKSADEFVNNFILKGITNPAQKAILVPEFQKHAKLIPDFAKDLDKAFSDSGPDNYKKANVALDVFFRNVGDWTPNGNVIGISDIKTWIELMSVTGLLHGSTLSFTRHQLTYQYISRKSSDPVFGPADGVALAIAGGTLLGLTKEKHVFASKIYDDGSLLKPPLPPGVKDVLDEYDGKSTKLKKSFYAEQQKNRPNFLVSGWILSDHFPDGVDGKQLTITTYI